MVNHNHQLNGNGAAGNGNGIGSGGPTATTPAPDRPQWISLEVADRICRRAAKGIALSRACDAEGIELDLFTRCVLESKNPELRALYNRASVEFEEKTIDRILAEDLRGRGDLFLLERKFGWAKAPDPRFAKPGGDAQSNQTPIPEDLISEIQTIAQQYFTKPPTP